ncbi:hypothetical protein ACFQ1E_20080 [Sphingomonas canadensis]|uniref:CdiA C-terminal tRNase domain-containing protein n=1 Tax=Sphingomonas canadensis TaxID=1219257 RepID=A0ABW3HBN2_9SPHN
MGGELVRARKETEVDYIFVNGPFAGKKVDFVLTPSTRAEADNINKYFYRNRNNLFNSIEDHLEKADIVPIDSRFFDPVNYDLLIGTVNRIPVKDRSRIIIYR